MVRQFSIPKEKAKPWIHINSSRARKASLFIIFERNKELNIRGFCCFNGSKNFTNTYMGRLVLVFSPSMLGSEKASVPVPEFKFPAAQVRAQIWYVRYQRFGFATIPLTTISTEAFWWVSGCKVIEHELMIHLLQVTKCPFIHQSCVLPINFQIPTFQLFAIFFLQEILYCVCCLQSLQIIFLSAESISNKPTLAFQHPSSYLTAYSHLLHDTQYPELSYGYQCTRAFLFVKSSSFFSIYLLAHVV